MNKRFQVRHEIGRSLKWAGALAIPAALLFFLLLTVLGGIEGGGKLLFMIGLAPTIVLEPFIGERDGPLIWIAWAVLEFLYLSAIVLLCRYLASFFRN